MFNIILTVVLLTIAQMLIGSLWYSKFLFGSIFMKYGGTEATLLTPAKVKKSFLLAIGVAMLKAFAIYIITSNVFYVLPQYFFSITIAIVILNMLLGFDEAIWGVKHIKVVLLNVSENGVSMLVSFLIALMIIS